jgi:hypothetical protein
MSTDRVLLPSAVKPSLYKLELTPDLQLLTFSCDEEVIIKFYPTRVHRQSCMQTH